MSSTGQQSSSRHVEKAPAKHLTLLQEKESENADLRRQVRDLQQDRNKDLTRIEEFEKEHKAQLKTIDRLQKENSIYKKYDVEREDLFEEIRVADRRQRLELADARNMTNEISSSVPLSASTKAESKEQANPQLEQSGSQNNAEGLESRAMSIDTSEDDFETVKYRKIGLAGGAGSEAIIPTGSLSNTNVFRAIDPDDPVKKKRAPKKARNLNHRPAPTRYAAPSAEVNSDEQSRADLTTSTPRRISFSAPDPDLSALAGTSGWGSGRRRVFDTLPSMQRRSALQAPNSPPTPRNLSQPEHVRSLAIPHGAESVMDFAQVAATPTGPTSGGKRDLVKELWEDYNDGLEVKVDLEKAFADWKRKRAAKSSRPGKEQTQGVGESSTPKIRHSTAATAGLQSVDKDVVSETKSRWSEETEEDGGVEVTGNVPKAGLVKDVLPQKEGVASQSGSSRTMDRSPKEGHTPAKAPATHIKLEKDSTFSIEADKEGA